MDHFDNIGALIRQLQNLSSEVERLKARVQELEYFEKENKFLRRENEDLKEKLAKYENPKNSNNSSMPPSKDENRAFKSKDKVKLLHWQGSGYLLYYKRLEKGTFELPRYDVSIGSITLSYAQLVMIMDGLSIKNLQKRIRYTRHETPVNQA